LNDNPGNEKKVNITEAEQFIDKCYKLLDSHGKIDPELRNTIPEVLDPLTSKITIPEGVNDKVRLYSEILLLFYDENYAETLDYKPMYEETRNA